MKDIEIMFDNAKSYNREDSQIYKDAVDLQVWNLIFRGWSDADKFLQKEARILAENEKKKPDTDYMMEDGRLPLPNGILHNGQLWKVGALNLTEDL